MDLRDRSLCGLFCLTFVKQDILYRHFTQEGSGYGHEICQGEGLTPVDEAEQMSSLMKEYAFNQYQLGNALAGIRNKAEELLADMAQ